MPLTFTARKLGKFTNRITVNMDVKVTDSTVVYPLKAEADRANNDHWNGGVKEHEQLQHLLSDIGPNPPGVMTTAMS